MLKSPAEGPAAQKCNGRAQACWATAPAAQATADWTTGPAQSSALGAGVDMDAR